MNMDISQYIPNFLFILLRAGIVLMLMPVFGSQSFPPQFRIGLAVAIALVLAPVIPFQVARAEIPAVVAREVMFGMVFGLAARFIFLSVDMAGQVMSNATGLSMATLFNPEIGQSTEISQLYGIITMLLFLAMDIHHDLIAVFVRSYEWLPAGAATAGALAAAGVSFATKLFVIALKISAPVIIAMFIANLLMGFIYKAAPQINIFFVGYPVHLFVGFLVMLISIPVFVLVMGGYFNGLKDELSRVVVMMKG